MWILVVLLIISCLLLALGVRGARSGDQRTCRGCRFDLTGLAPGASRCPECGADLTRRRATTTGIRQRRPVMIALGAIGLLLSATLGGTLLWAGLTRYDLNRLKPDWWLAVQATSASGRAADPLFAELTSRLTAGTFSGTPALLLVGRALREQANPAGEWFGRWDAVFGAALANGWVSDDQLRAFAAQVYDLRLRHRPTIRLGSPWTVGEWVTAVRVPPGAAVATGAILERVDVGGRRVYERLHAPGTVQTSSVRAGAHKDWVLRRYEMPGLPGTAGVQPILAVFAVAVQDNSATAPRQVEVRVEHRGEIELVDAGAELVTLARDESLRQRVEGSISARPLQLYLDPRSVHTWSAVDVWEPPIDLAFEVFVRLGDREWPVGRSTMRAGQGGIQNYGGHEFPLHGLEEAETVTLVLRPSAAAAEQASEEPIERIWGEEVVLPEVPIERIDRRQGG